MKEISCCYEDELVPVATIKVGDIIKWGSNLLPVETIRICKSGKTIELGLSFDSHINLVQKRKTGFVHRVTREYIKVQEVTK